MNDVRLPESSRDNLALRTLAVGVALQCVGLWRTVHLDGTALGTTLFMTLGLSEDVMLAVELGAAWLVLAVGIAILFRPWRAGLVAIGAWFGLLAALSWYQGGYFGYQYSVLAHATRILAPLALAAMVWPRTSAAVRREVAEKLLRIAAAVTFATHGLEALQHHPEFIDYLITAFRRVGIGFSEPAARVLLTAIGVQDFVLAALILTQRWRAVAGYMAVWGIVTAMSRMVHMGPAKWPATVIRSANWAVPLALWYLWAPSPKQPERGEDESDQQREG